MVVNACDAGREGELIFAYLYEKAGSKKPVQRLWLNSMTQRRRSRTRSRTLRPGAELARLEAGRPLTLGGRLDRRHERDARGDDPAALVVRRRRLARARADADARDPRPPRGGDPRLQARAVLARRRELRAGRRAGGRARYEGRYHAGAKPRLASAAEAERDRRGLHRSGRRDHQAREAEQHASARRMLYRPDLACSATRTPASGSTARRTLAAAQRLYEEHKALTYPRTNSRYLTSDMVGGDQADRPARRRAHGVRGRGDVRARPRRAAARARRRRLEGDRPPRDHPDERRAAPGRQDGRRRPARSTTWSCAASWRSSIPRLCSRTRASRRRCATHVFRTRGKLLLVPGWRGVYGETADGDDDARDDDEGAEQRLPRLKQGEPPHVREVAARAQGDQAAAPLHRRLAAGRDGDRRQARRRRGAARGDEGLRDRHPGDARGDHRAAARRSATSSATAARWW